MITETPATYHDERSQTITAIVIHDSAGADLKDLLQGYIDDNAGQSIHYIIAPDGALTRCVPDSRKAFHVSDTDRLHGQRDVNDFSIGIILVISDQEGETYNEAQLDSLINLVTELVRDYRIPLNRVVGHDFIGPAGDPGEAFPWFEFLNSVGSIVAQEDISDPVAVNGAT